MPPEKIFSFPEGELDPAVFWGLLNSVQRSTDPTAYSQNTWGPHHRQNDTIPCVLKYFSTNSIVSSERPVNLR